MELAVSGETILGTSVVFARGSVDSSDGTVGTFEVVGTLRVLSVLGHGRDVSISWSTVMTREVMGFGMSGVL